MTARPVSPERRVLYCCGCNAEVQARLTDGREIYPHRPDLAALPFWRCDACGNHVGCHHKTADRTKPLGNIPTPEIRYARRHIHALIDPIWERGRYSRSYIYTRMSEAVGRPYHTAEIRTIDEARNVYRIARELIQELMNKAPNRPHPSPKSKIRAETKTPPERSALC